MKKNNYLKWIFLALCVAINVFIIVNACLNGETSSEESGRFARWFANVINLFKTGYINNQNFDAFAAMIRKLVGHFDLFVIDGMITLSTAYLFLKDSKLKDFYWFIALSLLIGFVVAAASELIQIFTPGRYGSFTDIGIDFGGFLLGSGVSFAILVFFNFVNFKKRVNI